VQQKEAKSDFIKKYKIKKQKVTVPFLHLGMPTSHYPLCHSTSFPSLFLFSSLSLSLSF
jgi:hypothetical protein